MLTAELVRPRLSRRKGNLNVKMISLVDYHWQQTAGELITLFQTYSGSRQENWESALAVYEGSRTDYTVIRGLAKVLSDGASFKPGETPIPPVELRTRLFERGPVFNQPDLLHPQTRDEVLYETAAELGLSSSENVQEFLYADRPAAYLMVDSGPGWTVDELIMRYNLELTRAALYWADQLQVHIYDNFKDFWRYLKLFKLMFWATPLEREGRHGYQIMIDGPISPFVHSTTRYGRQMAAFLPALLLGEQWQMWANVKLPQYDEELSYYLDQTLPLSTHFKGSSDFDSKMEANFAAEFHEKFGDERSKWLLTREDEIILLGDTVMIPDFTMTHKNDGRRALIEIVGFWHPDYLSRKVKKVREANRSDLILLVYEGVNLAKEKLTDVPSEVLYFAKKPVMKDVLAAVERVAVQRGAA